MKLVSTANIAAIVLMTGMTFAQTNFNTTPQEQTTCTPVFSAFDAAPGVQTFATSINGRGEITGFYYQDPEEFQTHGFVRAVDGTITTFNVFGNYGTPTFPVGISSSGKIMGFYFIEKISHGFLRAGKDVSHHIQPARTFASVCLRAACRCPHIFVSGSQSPAARPDHNESLLSKLTENSARQSRKYSA